MSKKKKSSENVKIEDKNILVGCPTSFKSEYCILLIEHMKKGFSFESFAGLDEVDVCIKTLYNWEKQFPEFLHAKERGLAKALLKWEQTAIEGIYDVSIYDNITGRMIESKRINATVFRMNMLNRFKWSDSAAQIQKTVKTEEKPKRLIINNTFVEKK